MDIRELCILVEEFIGTCYGISLLHMYIIIECPASMDHLFF